MPQHRYDLNTAQYIIKRTKKSAIFTKVKKLTPYTGVRHTTLLMLQINFEFTT